MSNLSDFDPFWSKKSILGDFGRKCRFGVILTHYVPPHHRSKVLRPSCEALKIDKIGNMGDKRFGVIKCKPIRVALWAWEFSSGPTIPLNVYFLFYFGPLFGLRWLTIPIGGGRGALAGMLF